MLLFYVKFAMRSVDGVVILLRLTRGEINAFLRRVLRYGYVSAVCNIDDMTELHAGPNFATRPDPTRKSRDPTR